MMRCSFEQTCEILNDAAVFSECDKLQGISENIMLGQLGRIGTGSFDLILNSQMLKHAVEYSRDETVDIYDDWMSSPANVTPSYILTRTPSMGSDVGPQSPM